MTETDTFEIFLVATPGLEDTLVAEARDKGFSGAKVVKGGVTLTGGWSEVWRANLKIRGATRVLARIGAFRALHLAQLDKRARKLPWKDVLRPDVAFRVEASCKSSRIYHSGATAQRIERAIREELGAPSAADADITVMARIEDDLCTVSVDTSGELLHKRGHKEAVNKAPMRETMAAMFLRQCGYRGTEPVVDPMCGSGTFIIEAAEIAMGLEPGRTRHFAFEQLATFDAKAWTHMRDHSTNASVKVPAFKLYGSDRDAGAITMSRANAQRAGVTHLTQFNQLTISELAAPEGAPGLVIVNPPYGARLGESSHLKPLYNAMGRTLFERFSGWRVGLITTDPALAKATGLPFKPAGAPVSHGGLRVRLYQTAAL
ncbi:MAG TPA: class I SAM-dependent RNA methyltransferase [Hyphomicrobiaceae bacterium]|nr:class I SAM-dependent RNA methyltransferase [Hyphomicrobiaceae bacterium]